MRIWQEKVILLNFTEEVGVAQWYSGWETHETARTLQMLCNLQVSKRTNAENAEATGAPRRPRFPTQKCNSRPRKCD